MELSVIVTAEMAQDVRNRVTRDRIQDVAKRMVDAVVWSIEHSEDARWWREGFKLTAAPYPIKQAELTPSLCPVSSLLSPDCPPADGNGVSRRGREKGLGESHG
jgi:hypothetical protein